ncbi:MAG: NYN domain-containing protein [Verrucomicrobiota bacterium]
MHAAWLIVDGYSLLHRDPALKPTSRGGLKTARQRLVRNLEEVAGLAADRITVVFDGTASGSGEGYESAVQVLFSPSHQTADTVIERLVHACPEPGQVLVVTSDLAERHTVSAAGAHTMSCGDFLASLEEQRKRVTQRTASARGRAPRAKLGDFFPES